MLLLAIVLAGPHASAAPLADLFWVKNKKNKKTLERWDRLPLPAEYGPFLRAKALLAGSSTDLGRIESVQRELLLAPGSAETRTLLKELEDQFHALEIRRGVALSRRGGRRPQALAAFQRALGGLGTFKWVLYWGPDASKALAGMCLSGKKKIKDEACLSLAKRVVDVFPKAANEVKVLRELPSPEAVPGSDASVERLVQSYSEKFEKDEEAFAEVLESFLAGRDSDLIRAAKQFVTDFPKSSHRFRAQFMMAETHRRNRREREAEPIYRSLIDQVPLSYYAVVSAERVGVSLKDRVSKDPVEIDLDRLGAGSGERVTIERAKALLGRNHQEEVGIELDSLSRFRQYPTSLLLYLMKLSSMADQNILTFRFGNELIQRGYEVVLRQELIDLMFPDRFLPEIAVEAAKTGVDPVVLSSLIKQESGFKPGAISSSGALGLMQLMPFTAIDVKKDLALSVLRDPKTNISLGARYLQSLLERYSGNLPYALAAYNAGPHRVTKWRKESKPEWTMLHFVESIPYKETRDYVSSILRNRYWYQVRRGQVPAKITDIGL